MGEQEISGDCEEVAYQYNVPFDELVDDDEEEPECEENLSWENEEIDCYEMSLEYIEGLQ